MWNFRILSENNFSCKNLTLPAGAGNIKKLFFFPPDAGSEDVSGTSLIVLRSFLFRTISSGKHAYEVGESEWDEKAVGGRSQLRRAQEHEKYEEVAAHSYSAHERERRAHRVMARDARGGRRRRVCVRRARRELDSQRQRRGDHCRRRGGGKRGQDWNGFWDVEDERVVTREWESLVCHRQEQRFGARVLIHFGDVQVLRRRASCLRERWRGGFVDWSLVNGD